MFFDASYEVKQNETEKGGTGLEICLKDFQ